MTNKKYNLDNISETDLAIIGMSCRFPGANNIEEFLQNLKNGKESVEFFSKDDLNHISSEMLNNKKYIRAGATISNIKKFDFNFFGISKTEAEIMDPQHRVFLECVWEAMESSGCDSYLYDGRIGILLVAV